MNIDPKDWKEKLIKMRYFITSDIHGYYSVLIKELNKQGFDKNKDTLITLGDNFDRGPENWEMYNFLSTLPNVILVRGNHEDCLLELINRGFPLSHDFHNKTVDTLGDVMEKYNVKISWNNFEKMISTAFYKWLTSDKWVDKVEFNNLVLTHATIPNNIFKSFKQSRWADPTINRVPNKILVCGHWFAYLARRDYNKDMNKDDETDLYYGINLPENTLRYFYEPYFDKNLIMIDACTPATKRCNILIYDDETEELSYNGKVICKSNDKEINI